jgi:hypothetical protein
VRCYKFRLLDLLLKLVILPSLLTDRIELNSHHSSHPLRITLNRSLKALHVHRLSYNPSNILRESTPVVPEAGFLLFV